MKVIAEVGSNWLTFDDAKNSIPLAKACGADIVKFQIFDSKSLWGIDTGPLKSALPLDWIPKLSDKARACGIEFMVTAFSPELAYEVDPYVQTHKVASSDLTHLRLLEALNRLKKPVILSTGAHGLDDVQAALNVLKDVDVTVLYCVAAYPARFINFHRMDQLKKFGRPVGYSDHSTDVMVVPLEAKKRGAVVIEKHVNLVGVTGTPDAPHSLSLDEFMLMVKALKGDAVPDSSQEEMAMILKHNRRLIAVKQILPGDKLVEGLNFGAFRSLKEDSKALSPWLLDKVNGKTARTTMGPGDPITFDSFC